eukprot:c10262_g1_i1.p1 GENE.c10262_g1_i1~~c10262_g1_i1.p1  ORF type:complete len:294 (+),score=83.72 c10262_g1_i1:89-970(+)
MLSQALFMPLSLAMCAMCARFRTLLLHQLVRLRMAYLALGDAVCKILELPTDWTEIVGAPTELLAVLPTPDSFKPESSVLFAGAKQDAGQQTTSPAQPEANKEIKQEANKPKQPQTSGSQPQKQGQPQQRISQEKKGKQKEKRAPQGQEQQPKKKQKQQADPQSRESSLLLASSGLLAEVKPPQLALASEVDEIQPAKPTPKQREVIEKDNKAAVVQKTVPIVDAEQRARERIRKALKVDTTAISKKKDKDKKAKVAVAGAVSSGGAKIQPSKTTKKAKSNANDIDSIFGGLF